MAFVPHVTYSIDDQSIKRSVHVNRLTNARSRGARSSQRHPNVQVFSGTGTMPDVGHLEWTWARPKSRCFSARRPTSRR